MLKLEHIFKSYDKPLFENFNLEIEENSITCILGGSGVGKTTLLKMIAGLIDYKGKIDCPSKVAFIFQDDRLIPSLTVRDNLKLTSPNKCDKEIEELLKILGLVNVMDRYPKSLSGGEAKRVAMARAFLYDGDVILMDEAFSSLDLNLKLKLIGYFADLWNKNKKTVIFVTHDIDEAMLLAQKILILKDGQIISSFDLNSNLPRKVDDNFEVRSKIIEDLLNQ